jgi:hypothetical protein
VLLFSGGEREGIREFKRILLEAKRRESNLRKPTSGRLKKMQKSSPKNHRLKPSIKRSVKSSLSKGVRKFCELSPIKKSQAAMKVHTSPDEECSQHGRDEGNDEQLTPQNLGTASRTLTKKPMSGLKKLQKKTSSFPTKYG